MRLTPPASPWRPELATQLDRPLPDAVEVAAYYVVSEALTNVAT
jgi:signal transduction histidine kinase